MIIVLGYGNSLRGDDGVGVKIVQKLEAMCLPNHIKVIEGASRGIDVLINTEEFEKLIIIDSVISGGKEGSLYRMTIPELPETKNVDLTTHGSSWISFLKTKVESGEKDYWSKVVFYGIEIKNTTIGTELSPEIANRIPEYIDSILEDLQ